MSDEDKDAAQPQNAGSGHGQVDAASENVGTEADKPVSTPGEIARIITRAEREAFDALFVDAGGKPKWKSREKFIMAGCTLLKKVTLGELVMFRGKGDDVTKVDVIEVSIPAKRAGGKIADKNDDAADDEKAEETEQEVPDISVTSALDPSLADHPVARYFVLVSKVLNAEKQRDKVFSEAEKVVKSAQKTLDSFLANNWDALKRSRLITPAVEMEMKERARLAEIKKAEDSAEKRKEMAKLEMEAARDKP